MGRDELKREIGGRIEALRKSRPLTQAELTGIVVKAIGRPLSKGQIGRWENGDNLPPTDVLLAIATEFQVPLDTIVMGEDAFLERALKEMEARFEPRIRRLERHAGFA